jgi:hypothetical protein
VARRYNRLSVSRKRQGGIAQEPVSSATAWTEVHGRRAGLPLGSLCISPSSHLIRGMAVAAFTL